MMLAYSKFPNFCCLGLCPKPNSSWRVTNSKQEHIEGNRYEITTVTAVVPMCSRCRWGLFRRQLVVAFGTFVAATVGFVAPFAMGPRSSKFLCIGMFTAIVAGFVGFWVLRKQLKTNTLLDIAYITHDGRDIRFWNEDYQKLYTGEVKVGPQRRQAQPGSGSKVSQRESSAG